MQIIKTVIMVLCIIPISIAIYYYVKMRKLLKENSDNTLDKITPKIQSLMKKISVALYILVAMFAVYAVMLIMEIVLK